MPQPSQWGYLDLRWKEVGEECNRVGKVALGGGVGGPGLGKSGSGGNSGFCHILPPFPDPNSLTGLFGLAPAILLIQVQVDALQGLELTTDKRTKSPYLKECVDLAHWYSFICCRPCTGLIQPWAGSIITKI